MMMTTTLRSFFSFSSSVGVIVVDLFFLLSFSLSLSPSSPPALSPVFPACSDSSPPALVLSLLCNCIQINERKK